MNTPRVVKVSKKVFDEIQDLDRRFLVLRDEERYEKDDAVYVDEYDGARRVGSRLVVVVTFVEEIVITYEPAMIPPGSPQFLTVVSFKLERR